MPSTCEQEEEKAAVKGRELVFCIQDAIETGMRLVCQSEDLTTGDGDESGDPVLGVISKYPGRREAVCCLNELGTHQQMGNVSDSQEWRSSDIITTSPARHDDDSQAGKIDNKCRSPFKKA